MTACDVSPIEIELRKSPQNVSNGAMLEIVAPGIWT